MGHMATTGRSRAVLVDNATCPVTTEPLSATPTHSSTQLIPKALLKPATVAQPLQQADFSTRTCTKVQRTISATLHTDRFLFKVPALASAFGRINVVTSYYGNRGRTSRSATFINAQLQVEVIKAWELLDFCAALAMSPGTQHAAYMERGCPRDFRPYWRQRLPSASSALAAPSAAPAAPMWLWRPSEGFYRSPELLLPQTMHHGHRHPAPPPRSQDLGRHSGRTLLL
ncbi:hypothetical protein T492DRAFT_875298 [Pavlovales sp. CCMP2436]|nr:hypothetical protein T492DRAFT_875298 [Pavlovales sp. CCMP2436]